jgi:SAM-dependent methyltransferase
MKRWDFQYHSLLVKGIERRAIRQAIRAHGTGVLADIGCGKSPYRYDLHPRIQLHVGIDLPSTRHGTGEIDIFASAYDTSLKDDSVDTILCTQVLEHLEEPSHALKEFSRVLKPGGKVILTTNLIWFLHEEPRDFFRFTWYGLQYLFEKNHFKVLEITPLGGFWTSFLQILSIYVSGIASRFKPALVFVVPICLMLQGFAYVLDRLHRWEKATSHYLVVAKKP